MKNKTEPGWVVINRGNELENVHMHMKMHIFPFYCAALFFDVIILWILHQIFHVIQAEDNCASPCSIQTYM